MSRAPRISPYEPTIARDATGHCTINWHTPDGLPPDACIAVTANVIIDWVSTTNALVDCEYLLGIRK